MKAISPFKGKAAAFTRRPQNINYSLRYSTLRVHLLPKLSAGICMEYHSADSDADG
mgnify:CR=1 FL=1